MEINNRETFATIILLCMVAFWIVSTFRKKIRDERKKKILKEGVEANATILNIKPTGEYLNNLPEFQVKVKIKPKAGDDFVAEMTEILSYSKYDSMRQGSQVLVKYDPEYYKRVIFLQISETLA
ncbi:hypothetical protein [Dyadobacter pollutisoli]|uniref:DUF3592 domain-containing protein n=1 Tax=Dyadobacter pollutisoli TaxID=2910158 RepID=A0A9E8NF62_9BACT|nr:hypothetical protein [Dyadobacter pollutisoli]WAC13821.1 hypothetical protein ON006_07630 [Dyadobacter pollutisoli]